MTPETFDRLNVRLRMRTQHAVLKQQFNETRVQHRIREERWLEATSLVRTLSQPSHADEHAA